MPSNEAAITLDSSCRQLDANSAFYIERVGQGRCFYLALLQSSFLHRILALNLSTIAGNYVMLFHTGIKYNISFLSFLRLENISDEFI